MFTPNTFDLRDFLPYLLNQAADVTSLEFQPAYKDRYGMLRTEWRVLFHLGRYGSMTAKEVCIRARIHKTKVSRAVSALEAKRFLSRGTVEQDRRLEQLTLTKTGHSAYEDLNRRAQIYDAKLSGQFTVQEAQILRKCLERIALLPDGPKTGQGAP